MHRSQVTVSDTTPGSAYSLARYDSGDLTRRAGAWDFVANATSYTFVDPKPIASDSAAFYVCTPSG